jgi:hypothetical protein
MIVQVIVLVLACVAASLLAIPIAGLSLSIFGRILKRTEETREE